MRLPDLLRNRSNRACFFSAWITGDKDTPPIGLSIEDQRREISERHERSRRLLDAVFDEVVTTQKPGAPNADR